MAESTTVVVVEDDRQFGELVLDVMLLGEDGFGIRRRIRVVSMLPIVMLTATGDAIDRIIGPELGADDYLV